MTRENVIGESDGGEGGRHEATDVRQNGYHAHHSQVRRLAALEEHRRTISAREEAATAAVSQRSMACIQLHLLTLSSLASRLTDSIRAGDDAEVVVPLQPTVVLCQRSAE